jgi:putative mRNA 3-end processing factor
MIYDEGMELLSLSSKGLYCAPGNFYIDPWSKVETALITHAHGDHARWGMGHYICAEDGQHILLKRIPDAKLKTYQYGETFWMNDVKVSFHPAGHILGSAQIRLEWKGEVWVFTGDFKRDADLTCRPFEIIPCDVFISEATFSLPVYHWPSFQDEMKKVYQWWMENREEGVNSVLCCYALGKAQRIIAGLRELTKEPIWVHGTIDELNHCYEKSGVSFEDVRKVPVDKKIKLSGDMILCPPSDRRIL